MGRATSWLVIQNQRFVAILVPHFGSGLRVRSAVRRAFKKLLRYHGLPWVLVTRATPWRNHKEDGAYLPVCSTGTLNLKQAGKRSREGDQSGAQLDLNDKTESYHQTRLQKQIGGNGWQCVFCQLNCWQNVLWMPVTNRTPLCSRLFCIHNTEVDYSAIKEVTQQKVPKHYTPVEWPVWQAPEPPVAVLELTRAFLTLSVSRCEWATKAEKATQNHDPDL
jgi:hypothetical protein